MRAGLLAILTASVILLSACGEIVDRDTLPPPTVERQRASRDAAPPQRKPKFKRMSDEEVRHFISKHENEVIIETEGVVRYRDWVAERQPSGDWIAYKP